MKPISLNAAFLLILSLVCSSCKKENDSKSDKIKPVITLMGSENMEISLGSNTPDPGATATDDQDGDISAQVTSDWNSKINMTVNGEYIVIYSVKDKGGNEASKTRKVTVKMGSGSYSGTYLTTFKVVNGGSSTTTCYIVAGSNPNQFTVNYYLGPGGPPFNVNVSGIFGTELTIVPTTAGGADLSGSGYSENNGAKIILNIKDGSSLELICTMIKQ